ncbi:hypothetical protein E1B28_001940 [Marasmius oreades]|uniref:Uncharacterized protein n=1 Tax=Marasmius oreades TaxID=181124 RepID=A0A9P7V4J3_9AGAR|nr:uncharacterized protein E1B28_001940 [Marasmius oreades]KAG7100160.1 hypothetical protein E1B28_001940 [Marasmius oreades]
MYMDTGLFWVLHPRSFIDGWMDTELSFFGWNISSSALHVFFPSLHEPFLCAIMFVRLDHLFYSLCCCLFHSFPQAFFFSLSPRLYGSDHPPQIRRRFSLGFFSFDHDSRVRFRRRSYGSKGKTCSAHTHFHVPYFALFTARTLYPRLRDKSSVGTLFAFTSTIPPAFNASLPSSFRLIYDHWTFCFL